ncbi:hypothetical protein OG889_10220 [Streptomyces sp. NBC_00481]|uniref:hypothetical protein n=1 Tax=unclassified Streptomyces TaxID=2593676 RepID=UPI002DD9DCBB|nr:MULTISPECIES: hypothetical protein [unclassified Streptomyces]WRY95070.1 hypothetical protein OG889_10220 [Streptomyces sp. NBC_00481]
METEHGTPKIAHVGYADGSDPGSSALSIDLMTAGTAAQGIFVTATDAPTKGPCWSCGATPARTTSSSRATVRPAWAWAEGTTRSRSSM